MALLACATATSISVLSSDGRHSHASWKVESGRIVAMEVPTVSPTCEDGGAASTTIVAVTIALAEASGSGGEDGTELVLLSIGASKGLDVTALRIMPVASKRLTRAVAHVSLYDTVVPPSNRVCTVAMSFWDSAADSDIVLASAEDVPLCLPTDGAKMISLRTVLESSLLSAVSQQGAHSFGFVGIDTVAQITSLLLTDLYGDGDDTPALPRGPPLLIAGLGDGRAVVASWATASSGGVFTEVVEFEIGREPVRLAPFGLPATGDFPRGRSCVLLNSNVDAVLHGEARDGTASPRSPRFLAAADALAARVTIARVVQVDTGAASVERCGSSEDSRRLCASVVSSLLTESGGVVVSLLWMDALGRLSLGDLAVPVGGARSPSGGKNAGRPGSLAADFVCSMRVASRASLVLFLPHLDLILAAGEEAVEEAEVASAGAGEHDGPGSTSTSSKATGWLRAFDASSGGDFAEVWRQDLAPGTVATALCLAPAPVVDDGGGGEGESDADKAEICSFGGVDAQGARWQTVAVANCKVDVDSLPPSPNSHVVFLELRLPASGFMGSGGGGGGAVSGAAQALRVLPLGGMAFAGICAGLGPIACARGVGEAPGGASSSPPSLPGARFFRKRQGHGSLLVEGVAAAVGADVLVLGWRQELQDVGTASGLTSPRLPPPRGHRCSGHRSNGFHRGHPAATAAAASAPDPSRGAGARPLPERAGYC